MRLLNVEIITPSKSAFKGQAKSVTVPGSLGNFQILFNHAPILSSLEIGKIKIENPDGLISEYAVGSGTVEVRDNEVLVLADSVELKSEIDVDRAMNSYSRAKERLSMRSKGDIDVARAESSLMRAVNRMKIAKGEK